MGPCSLKLDITPFTLFLIYQKPVAFDMAFLAADILSVKWMVFIRFTQLLSRFQNFSNLFKQAHVVATFLHQLKLFFELTSVN